MEAAIEESVDCYAYSLEARLPPFTLHTAELLLLGCRGANKRFGTGFLESFRSEA
jgi:hypothetical protein